MGELLHRYWKVGVAGLILVMLGILGPTAIRATIPNRQPWTHVPGNCPAGVQGAVFARPGDG